LSLLGMSTMLLFSAGAATASSPPIAGTYAANIIIAEADGPGCIHAEGTQFAGVLNYPGFVGTTMGLRVPIVAPAHTAAVSTQRFEVTSGAGTTHPQGTFTWQGQGLRLNWDRSGTFSATLTELDKVSFIVELIENYEDCREDRIVALTRVGPKLP
jgi:hypothetical protein